MDWPWKTTPNWLLTSWNPPTSSQVTVISSSCQLICTTIMMIWPHHSLGLQKLPSIDSPHAEIPSFIEFWWPVNFTKPNQMSWNFAAASRPKCQKFCCHQYWVKDSGTRVLHTVIEFCSDSLSNFQSLKPFYSSQNSLNSSLKQKQLLLLF